jgi:hypothetical protein
MLLLLKSLHYMGLKSTIIDFIRKAYKTKKKSSVNKKMQLKLTRVNKYCDG